MIGSCNCECREKVDSYEITCEVPNVNWYHLLDSFLLSGCWGYGMYMLNGVELKTGLFCSRGEW